MKTKNLECEMTDECNATVTHIDKKGAIFCTTHGIARRSWKPCRKLRPHELHRLERDEPVKEY